MRTLILLLSPFAYLFQTPEIRVRALEASPTQAVLVFEAPDTTNCSVKVAFDSEFRRLVHDANPELFPGAQGCGRPGNLVQGNTVTFVIGLRRAQKASDGKFYSRALEANTTFWYQITSGGQTRKAESFETRNPPLGNSYGEPFPFDKEAPGHYAWPTVDWTDANKEYIDPLTGVALKRFSGPGMMNPAQSRVTPAVAAFDTGSDWTGAANAAAIDGSAASATTQTPLFVRAPRMCITDYQCGVHASWGNPGSTIDNIQVSVKAWSSGARDLDLCITVDGMRCATAWKRITAGTSSGAEAVNFPQALEWSAFAEWMGGDFQAPPPRPFLSNYFGKVITNGTTVTLASGDRFPMDAWTTGSRITIAGKQFTIASVDSATTLTLDESAGSSNADYSANNVGVLLRKADTGTEPMQVDGVTFRWAHSSEMEMGASGFRNACSPKPVNDFEGAEGYMCWFADPQGYPGLWFISERGSSRFLGKPFIPYNYDVRGGAIDGNNAGECLNGFSISSSNPNQVFCVMISSAEMGYLIFKGTYHPDGLRGCAEAGGYRGVKGGKTCLFTWENLTKPSEKRAVGHQLANVAGYKQELFGSVRAFGSMGRHLGFFAWASQDSFAFSFWFDDTGTLVSWQDYHSSQPCRWCTVHSFFEAGQPDTGKGGWNAVVVKDTVGGHQETEVIAVEGATSSELNNSLQQECPDDLSDEWKDKGATGERCITVTLSGHPCREGASAAERTHLPACSWKAGAVQLQEMQVGDEAYGVSNGQVGRERFLVVRQLEGNRWVLMRNYNIMRGPVLAEPTSQLATHARGWKLRMACSAAVGSSYVWVKYTDPEHPKVRDYALSPAQHGDISPLGTMMASYCAEIDRYCIPIWHRGIPERIGQKSDRRWVLGHTFGNINVWGFAVFRGYIQSHPAWRQVLAPENEQGWFLDGNPWAPGAGGNYSLWNQPAERVEGDLFRLTSVSHTPMVRKVLSTIAWGGRHVLRDVSGPASVITGDPPSHWTYCVASEPGECVTGSAVGSVYMNIPGGSLDGPCGESFYHRRPCFTSMVLAGVGINQVGVRPSDIAGKGRRFLTAHMQRYNMTWTYSNAAPIPSGKYAVIGGSWLGGSRNDLLLMKVPPYPEIDSIDRSNFIPMNIAMAGAEGSSRVRVRFGYAENGPAEKHYCTTRQDACTTGGSPYAWESEAAAPVSCPSTGCSVALPGISGRVLYYQVDRLDSSGGVVGATRGAVVVP